MKNRLINLVKWFLIVLGILFSIQTILFIGAILGIVSFANYTPKFETQKQNYGDLAPVINYIDEYYKKNNKFPDVIKDVKTKKGLEYRYKVEKDGACYTINAIKDGVKKDFQYCKFEGEKTNSSSQSYIEFVEK